MIITEEKQLDVKHRLNKLFQELTDCLVGNHLPVNGPYDNKVRINGIEYDKSKLVEIDKKELDACLSRLENELKILKKL